MPKEIVCPSCGNRGEATTDDSGAFEVRGIFQGKAVRKCKKCGAGLLIGLFSGALWGKPKIIPSEQWAKMEDEFEKKMKEMEIGEEMRKKWEDYKQKRDEFLMEMKQIKEEDEKRRKQLKEECEKAWKDYKVMVPAKRKDILRISLVAKDYAQDIIDWGSMQFLKEHFGELLKDYDLSRIEDQIRRELLLWSMLAFAVGITKTSIPEPIMARLLQDVFNFIYLAKFSSADERANFEALFRERWTFYYENTLKAKKGIDKPGDIAFRIGEFFAKQILDTSDYAFIVGFVQFFEVQVKYWKDLLEDISRKFDFKF